MSSKLSPSVYIIIPNHHSEFHTIECLESVFKQQYQNYKVIIVDNSTGNTSLHNIIAWCSGEVEKVETKYPQYVYPLIKKPIFYKLVSEEELESHHVNDARLLFIKAKENNGFSAANNIALKYITWLDDYDWAWLLNNDTVIPPDCLQFFADGKINLSENTGIVGTKLLYYHKPGVYQGIGGKYNRWLGTIKQVGQGEDDKGQYDAIGIEKKVDYVIAASMFVSKGFLKSVGLMCEEYFFYFEEMDWVLRGKEKGWQIGYLPACVVFHKEGGSSTGKNEKSMLVDVAAVRNRFLFTRKFYPQFLPFVSISLIGIILNRIKRKQIKRVPLLLKAVLTNQSPKEFVKP